MSNEFEPLKPNEVLSLNVYDDYKPDIVYEQGMFSLPPTFRQSELKENIKDVLIGFHNYYGDTRRKFLNEGLSCEALKLGSKGWQKGKVRIRIEIDFCPDEPDIITNEPDGNSNQNSSPLDSSLDDIRSIINEG